MAAVRSRPRRVGTGRVGTKQSKTFSEELYAACLHGKLAAAQKAVKRGATARGRRPENKETVFFAACKGGHLKIAQWLYEEVNGARVTVGARNAFGRTPFLVACSEGYLELAKWLAQLPEGAESVLQPDAGGRTPFYCACADGRTAVMLWLFETVKEVRQDVCRVDKAGESPFFAACTNGHVAAARLLFQLPDVRRTVGRRDGIYGGTVIDAIFRNGTPTGPCSSVLKWMLTLPEAHVFANLALCHDATPEATAWIHQEDNRQYVAAALSRRQVALVWLVRHVTPSKEERCSAKHVLHNLPLTAMSLASGLLAAS